MNYIVHATPVHPSLCLQYLILLFTINTATVFILLLLLLFYYCHHYKTIATNKSLRASLFPSAAELTTYLLRLRASPLMSPTRPPAPLFFIRTAKNGPVAPPVPRFRPNLGLHPSGEPRPSPAFRGALGDSGRNKLA
jgi:hypothetical protein